MSEMKDFTAGWLEGATPSSHVALASRARFARNLANQPFVPHAHVEALERIFNTVLRAVEKAPTLAGFQRLDLEGLAAEERTYLKELRLISQEMERGGPWRAVLLAPDRKASIMINEEDHLRIQCIEPGLQLDKVIARLTSLETALAAVLPFATHPRFGYLSACPTNLGTGLRVSVMLHLPALTITREIENILSSALPLHGLTVRGFNGENSEFLGDFYQLSNEHMMGKTVEQIVADLAEVTRSLIDREEETRAKLFKEKATVLDDAIWRSFALLTNARRISSKEAMMLLSRLRFGIDRGYFPPMTHESLNRLFVAIQPAHLARKGEAVGDDDASARDEARAAFLRDQLKAEKN